MAGWAKGEESIRDKTNRIPKKPAGPAANAHPGPSRCGTAQQHQDLHVASTLEATAVETPQYYSRNIRISVL